jgi:signal transduction histidine kinase
VYGGIVQVPHLGAPFFFPVLLVMGYELSEEVLSAARLTHRLQVSEASLRESEQRMRLVASEAQQLSGRLINAQEDERRRIARELHDDLSQRLGVMSVQLDLLRRSSDDPASAPVIQRLASEVGALSSEIHALSYTLHPAKLDQLGLDSAARGWCRDLDAQSGLAFDFVSGDVPSDLSPDAALCLYRILQETTRNIVRHSGATAARVELSMEADGLHLTVEDPGRGFDLTRAGTSGGLGLVSMRERVRLLKGTLVIDSEPGRGTRVEAVVPIAASASERADSRAARGALHEPT